MQLFNLDIKFFVKQPLSHDENFTAVKNYNSHFFLNNFIHILIKLFTIILPYFTISGMFHLLILMTSKKFVPKATQSISYGFH